MNYFTFNLAQKVQAINQYLTPRLTTQPKYQTLINELNTIIENWHQNQIRVTILGHSESLIKNILFLKESNLKFRSLCEINTGTIPNNLDKFLRNCDLLCLVNDGTKPVSKIEQKLISKIATANIVSYCLVITDNIIYSNNGIVKTIKYENLFSYLKNKKLHKVTRYFLPKIHLESIAFSQHLNEYHQFLESILEACIIKIEQKYKEDTLEIIERHFHKNKAQYFSQIKQLKNKFTPDKRIDKFKQKIKQTSNQLNKDIQNTFKTIKQEINQEKLQLTNPFMYDTMMYRIQAAIQNSSVIEYKEDRQIYLSLVIKNQEHNQSIHSYIMELCQKEIDIWIEQQWFKIDNDDGSGKINKLMIAINQKLEFLDLDILSSPTNIYKIENKFSFDISEYVSLSILGENNKTPFDYHYSQSIWFRIALVLTIVGIVFVWTNKIFGFIILLIQLVNLFTGRDPKTIKVKQQTKEMKRNIDNKCQFLARFIADKLLQNFSQYLDQQSQQYQQEINSIIKKNEQELETIQQTINEHRQQINIFKEDQEQLIKILQR